MIEALLSSDEFKPVLITNNFPQNISNGRKMADAAQSLNVADLRSTQRSAISLNNRLTYAKSIICLSARLGLVDF